MPSSPASPRPGRRQTLAALLLLVLGLSLGGTGIAGAREAGTAVVGGPIDGHVRVVVAPPDGPGAAIDVGSVVATVDGAPRPSQAVPLLSDQLALALVVDGSAEGRAVLPSAVSGAADLLLSIPSSTRTALVIDHDPPTAAPLSTGPAATLAALSNVSGAGERRTAQAIELALRQLPGTPTDPRLLVLCTTAADAGEPADDLVERLAAQGVVLAVVASTPTGQPASDYWATVSAGTGGLAVTVPPAQVIRAFDQVLGGLRGRVLVTLPVPARLPATVVVRGAASGRPISDSAVVPAAAVTAIPGAGRALLVPMALSLAVNGLVLLGALAVLVTRRRVAPPEPSVPASPSSSPAPLEPVWNVPARPEPAVARERLLAAVHDGAHAGTPVVLRSADGRPGSGSSTTMIEFAHRYRDQHDIAWWVPAGLPELVPDRLAELAETLGLAAPTDPVHQATARLRAALRARDRWLILVDDVEDAQRLIPLLPHGPGRVLMTVTDPGYAGPGTPLTNPGFTRADSVTLLRARCPGLPVDAAALVATALDNHPLAVDLAGATLAATDIDINTLQRRLGERASGPAESIWTVAVDLLAEADPGALALLTLVAWLGPEPVPLSLLGRDPAIRAELVDRAEELHRRGLARVTAETVQLHRWAVDRLLQRSRDERPDGTGWAVVAVRLLRAGLPDGPSGAPANRAPWRRLLPLVLTATDPTRPLDPVTAEVGWLLGGAAEYLQARGQPVAARALFEDAFELCRRHFGSDHPDTVAAADRLGGV